MLPLNVLLALILLICALAVVTARHQVRNVFIQLQAAEQLQRDLETEWGRLLLEQSTWSNLDHVERQAKKELNMVVPTPGQTVIMSPEITPPAQVRN
jgi:cell division protein FtsL